MPNVNRNNLVAILVGLSCGNAFATTAILTAQNGSMSSSFTNAANWAINGQPSGAVGAPLDPAVDYVNQGGKNLCPPRWYDESSLSVFVAC